MEGDDHMELAVWVHVGLRKECPAGPYSGCRTLQLSDLSKSLYWLTFSPVRVTEVKCLAFPRVSPSTAPGTPGAQSVAAVPEEVGEARLFPELSPAPGNQGRPPQG